MSQGSLPLVVLQGARYWGCNIFATVYAALFFGIVGSRPSTMAGVVRTARAELGAFIAASTPGVFNMIRADVARVFAYLAAFTPFDGGGEGMEPLP